MELIDDFTSFIHQSDAKSTLYSNTTAYNTFKRFLTSINETREITSLQPEDLDMLLGNFFIKATKLNGKEFEPDSLSTIHRALQRYLDIKKYSFNILVDKQFAASRKVLASKRKLLTKQGGGNKPHATRELTHEEVDVLFKNNYFGTNSPESLNNAVWWFTSLHFGFRARDEARKLKWGDIQFGYDENQNREYLEWNVDRGSKTRQGYENEAKRTFSPRVYETSNDRCPVFYYKEFARRRPMESLTPDAPFFLTINHKASLDKDAIWYLKSPMGRNKIGSILTTARKLYNFKGRKVANHSVQKTGLGHLLDSNVAETFVAQHAGMKSIDSLKSYKSPGVMKISEMSNVLSGGKHNFVTKESSTTSQGVVAPQNSGSTDVDYFSCSQSSSSSSSSKRYFSGNDFSDCNKCTFNFTINTGRRGEVEGNPPKKRRVILSSDEEN